MLFTSNLSICLRRNIRQIVRMQGYIVPVQMSTNVTPATITFKPKFSDEEQQKILTILNESNVEQLAQFDVTKVRIKNLESWRLKHGPFQSLSDILEVEGLGEKVLERLCNSIVFERQDVPPTTIIKTFNNSKNRKQILTPQLNHDLANRLKNAVGIHLAPTGVSWAKLSIEQNELEIWNFHDFSTLPQKLLPTDTFELALALLSKIPVSDVYIMEASPNQQVVQGKPMPTYTQNLELSSMLLALINTSPKHNLKVDSSDVSELQFNCDNRVYYLRANLPARLFRTLVGNERVAVTGIITKLLENNNTLPCSAISVKQTVRDFYGSQSAVHKEIMGQAIMLAITFMDLCVYKNPISEAAILPGRRQRN